MGHNAWLTSCTVPFHCRHKQHYFKNTAHPFPVQLGAELGNPVVNWAWWPLHAKQCPPQISLEPRCHHFRYSLNLTLTHLQQVRHNPTDDQYHFTARWIRAQIKGNCLSVSTPPKNHTWDVWQPLHYRTTPTHMHTFILPYPCTATCGDWDTPNPEQGGDLNQNWPLSKNMSKLPILIINNKYSKKIM